MAALKSVPRATAESGGGVCFPNYGGAKGQPVAGAAPKDLDYYAAGARRSLGDPEKSRFHAKETALLAAIDQLDGLATHDLAEELRDHAG